MNGSDMVMIWLMIWVMNGYDMVMIWLMIWVMNGYDMLNDMVKDMGNEWF